MKLAQAFGIAALAVSGVAALAAATVSNGAHADETAISAEEAALLSRFPTGLDPVEEDVYNALPKLGKYRAWLPKSVDLSAMFPPPGDQTPAPNCTAWATTYAGMGYIHARDLGKKPSAPSEQLSPHYIYNRLRPPGSTCTIPTGMVKALNLLSQEGTVTLAAYPGGMDKCTIPASPSLATGSGVKLASWRAIERETPGDWRTPVVIDDIKGALFREEPVVFAMPARGDFIMFKGPGVYEHPTKENVNWHAMALVGYDEDRQAFRLMNSWGRGWGDNGYAWIGYETFKRMVGEAYAMQAPQPEDPSLIGLNPKQRFDRKLAALPCGRAKLVKENGKTKLSGFAGSEEALGDLHKALLAADPQAKWDMDFHPWPQCEAQMTLATPLDAGGVSLEVTMASGLARQGDPVTMVKDEKFGLTAQTTAARPWVSIVYLQADGSAYELYRGQPKPDAARQRIARAGVDGAKDVQFKVGPPYGSEMVIAIASTEPFFGEEMRDFKTERQFLSGLRSRLQSAKPGSVSAAVLRIRTRD